MKNNISNSNTQSLHINLMLESLFIHKFQYFKINENLIQNSKERSDCEQNNSNNKNENIFECNLFYKKLLSCNSYYKKRINSRIIANDNKF